MTATTASRSNAHGAIRVGVGGWTYPPWRNNFYPAGLPQAQELAYAAGRLTAIEINATYYRLQSAKSFAKWRDSVPEGFVFSVKGSQYVTNRRVLGEAGEAIERFTASGLAELGHKLGPIVWLFATTKAFDETDFAAFLGLLPKKADGVALRHAVEVRHRSFMVPEFLALARRSGVATVFADSHAYPSFADVTGNFVYARLMRTQADQATGYPAADLDTWSERLRQWASGDEPEALPRIEPRSTGAGKGKPRDVFAFFISGAKERAPAAAMATLAAMSH